jgi:hypothetical protein
MIDVPQSRETFAERSANYNTLRSWSIKTSWDKMFMHTDGEITTLL